MNTLSKILSMNPTKTGQIPNTNIYAIKNMLISIYLINTKNGYIMVDAGINGKKITASLKKLGIDINDVNWILLTHSDRDHIDALPFFPNAEIYLSKDEFPLINGSANRHKSGGNKMPERIDINKIKLLSDRQELSFDETKVKCINAPGHTVGSLLFLIDNKYLFSGDAFLIKNGKLDVHPFGMSSEQSMKTIEHLKETINNCSIILTSHYGIKEN